MIVGSLYEGDDDTALAWRQHAVYGEALGVIISTGNRLTRFAKALLDDAGHENWGLIGRADHRTLQCAHDLLAAAWRFKNGSRQGELLKRSKDDLAAEVRWLNWLRDELSGWVEEPQLVRAVQLVLIHQNQPAGHEAERELGLGLVRRYRDIPWLRPLLESFDTEVGNEAGQD